LLWVLASRSVRVAAACRHGRRFSAFYVPVQVFSEWVGSSLKLWVSFHPVKQQWLNRGNRKLDSLEQVPYGSLRRALAHYLVLVSFAAFAIGIGTVLDLIPLWRELPLIWHGRAAVRASETLDANVFPGRELFGAE
jgi:hypothetical protein